MGEIVHFTAPKETARYVCGDCQGALFHWYEGYIQCVQCLAAYRVDDSAEE